MHLVLSFLSLYRHTPMHLVYNSVAAPDVFVRIPGVVSIFVRCVFPSFACFFCFIHNTTDHLRQIYCDTRHCTLYNGLVPVYPQQRNEACKYHDIAAVLILCVQKLSPAELQYFCCSTRITILL